LSARDQHELATIGERLGEYPGYLEFSDEAHTSPLDLQSFLKFDENRNLLGFVYGPHDKDLAIIAGYALSLQSDNLTNWVAARRAYVPQDCQGKREAPQRRRR
jgi:hypothetical protein